MTERLVLMIWILVCGVASWATPKVQVPVRIVESVPLPKGTHYLPSGLSAGMSLGTIARKDCQSRLQWMGGADYSYTPYLSGGGAVRMFGGNIDNSHSLVYTRYFIDAKFHNRLLPEMDVYIGPILGFDNTNIEEIRKDFRSGDTDADSSSCKDAFDVNGPSFGWDAGVGWLMHPYWGLTGSSASEINLQKKIRVSFSLGLAFNLLPQWKRLKDNLGAAWIHLDWIKAYTVHYGGSDNSLYLGVSTGF